MPLSQDDWDRMMEYRTAIYTGPESNLKRHKKAYGRRLLRRTARKTRTIGKDPTARLALKWTTQSKGW